MKLRYRIKMGAVLVGATVTAVLLTGATGTPLKADSAHIIGSETNGNVVTYGYYTNKLGTVKNEVSRTATSVTTRLAPNVFTLQAYSAPEFYQQVDGWYQINYATTSLDNFTQQTAWLPRAYAVFPSLVGGDANDADASWATAHAADPGSNHSTGTIATVASQISSAVYTIGRVFLPFDTSTIPSNASVVSANLALYAQTTSDGDPDGNDFIALVQTSQASTGNIANSDYAKTGLTTNPVEGATRVTIPSIAAPGTFTITLNATGFSFIKFNGQTSSCGVTAGATCLGLREGHDVLNDTITGVAAANNAIIATGASPFPERVPVLTIVYTIPDSGAIRIYSGTVHESSGIIHVQ